MSFPYFVSISPEARLLNPVITTEGPPAFCRLNQTLIVLLKCKFEVGGQPHIEFPLSFTLEHECVEHRILKLFNRVAFILVEYIFGYAKQNRNRPENSKSYHRANNIELFKSIYPSLTG